MSQHMKRAVLWDPAADKRIDCYLCNWRCSISPSKTGYCKVRKNVDGVLYSLNYSKVCAVNPDPIEKKPLFHFQPGSKSFSIAAVGCNFRCEFCQNWQISQMAFESVTLEGRPCSPELIVESAQENECSSIAYTYTEPTIFIELCEDCGRLAKANGIANVFVSNGYMTAEAIDYVADWLDAINVDLKAFTDDYYKRLCKARLGPVLDTIRHIARRTNIWMEITTLLIPGQNDSAEEIKQMADFIVENAGPDTPWHISRFWPNYKYQQGESTTTESIELAEEIGKKAGLRYVYAGNIPGTKSESTFCYKCGQMLIERHGYRIISNHIVDSKCPNCSTKIAGSEL